MRDSMRNRNLSGVCGREGQDSSEPPRRHSHTSRDGGTNKVTKLNNHQSTTNHVRLTFSYFVCVCVAGTGVPLDCAEAAAAVFPSLARPLQKYLRLTRQLPWHTAESVLNHLATSLRLGLAPRAFLDKFTNTPTPIHVTYSKYCKIRLSSNLSSALIS